MRRVVAVALTLARPPRGLTDVNPVSRLVKGAAEAIRLKTGAVALPPNAKLASDG